MHTQKYRPRLTRERYRMLPLCCAALLTMALAGCASTESTSNQLVTKSLSSCEQDLFSIGLALCNGDLEGKPKTDPHEVIGLKKPGTDPHKACFSGWRISSFSGAVCSCEIEKAKLMAKIMSCFEKHKDDRDGSGYTMCLNGLKSINGINCPSM